MHSVAEYESETKALVPARATFRATLARVADQARTQLPPEVNGRLESAVKLVLAGDVQFRADGTAAVASSSDPATTYTLAGGACDCQDFAYGQAPDGWCQHRLAANLQRSVERVLARHAVPVAPDADDGDGWPPDEPVAVETPAPAPTAALPEAPASANVYVQIDGHKVQVTLRDTDEARMLARLRVLLAQYPAAERPQAGAS